MSRCRATTKKGTRCKNPAMEGSEYCGVHARMHREGEGEDREASRAGGRRLWSGDLEDLTKAALGFALVGAVVLLAITRRR